MGQAFLRRMARTMALQGAVFAALSFGAIYFGFYLRWLFFVLCILGLLESWSGSTERELSAGATRGAQYLGFTLVAIPFGLVTFNLFGIVGFQQLAGATAAVFVLSLFFWLLSSAPLDH